MLKGFSKVLICGGFDPAIDTCEVINLESSAAKCQNPPIFPDTVYNAFGGVGVKENPIICGGYQAGTLTNRCFSLENNEWVSSVSMNTIRSAAAAAQLPDNNFFVTGGFNSAFLSSAEMLTSEGWENKTPSLPGTNRFHCMVTVNSTTVMAIGGLHNEQYSGKTFYFTFGEESWREGPELKNKRAHHSCGRLRGDKESQMMSITVAGGWDGSSRMSSVEILDEGSIKWKTGPELPFGAESSQMVEDPSGGVVLIGGASSSGVILDTLYQLTHGGQDASWTKMEQKLKNGRFWHTAFVVPDKTVDCS